MIYLACNLQKSLEMPMCEISKLEACFIFLKALILPEKFQHILRILNTNIDGRRKVMFAMTAIKVHVSTKF